jgi:hypothetical protein
VEQTLGVAGDRVHEMMASVLVAFTVEVDNAYEARAPHSTSKGGGHGPWLTSYGMWANLLRLVPDKGIAVRDLAQLAGYAKGPHPAQAGMVRWGYITVAAGPQRSSDRPATADMLVRRTSAGDHAASLWAPLATEVEDRWSERHGDVTVVLRQALEAVIDDRGVRVPGFLPQLDGSLRTAVPHGDQTVPGEPSLITALANCLHLFAIDFEQDAPVPLAVAANVLRVLDGTGIRVREVGPATGISNEAVRWSVRVLEPAWAEQIPDPAAARGKLVRLTEDGARLRTRCEGRIDDIERDWASRHHSYGTIRDTLAAITGDGARLRSGMVPPGRSWRPPQPPDQLPAFPVVLHRGAYPDGS